MIFLDKIIEIKGVNRQRNEKNQNEKLVKWKIFIFFLSMEDILR